MGKGSWFKKTDSYLHKHTYIEIFQVHSFAESKIWSVWYWWSYSSKYYDIGWVLCIEAIDGAENVFSDQTLIDFFFLSGHKLFACLGMPNAQHDKSRA